MTNQLRSKAFIKIKHSIESSLNEDHLSQCRRMIENCSSINTYERESLNRLLRLEFDSISPPYPGEDEILTRWHVRTCGGHSTY